MANENILKTAHIHIQTVSFRVHVENIDTIDFEKLQDTKPDFVNSVGRSNDPEQNKQSFLVETVDEYDLEIMADWISGNEIFNPTN